MDKVDLIFTVIFIISIVIAMVLIYYYNKRHKFVDREEEILYEYGDSNGEGKVVDANETFNWNIYESDSNHDYERFIGYDSWRNAEHAKNRIKQLKAEHKNSPDSIKLSMLESMMLTSTYSGNITLDSSGNYRIKKNNIDNFIKDLDYDPDSIKLISELKREIEFSIDNYEVDAREIFYVMSNANSLGLHNIQSNSQVFLFAKHLNNDTLDASLVDNKIEVGMLNILAVEFEDEYDSDSDNIEEIKESIYVAIKNNIKLTKVYMENGKRITEYPNGVKIIKTGLWEAEEVIDESSTREYGNKNTTKGDFVDLFDTSKNKASDKNIDGDTSEDSQEYSEKEISLDKLVESKKRTVVKKNTVEKRIKSVNLSDPKKKEIFDEINIQSIITTKHSSSSGSINHIGLLGEVHSVEEFIEKLSQLEGINFKVIFILLFTPSASVIEIENELTFMHFVDVSDNHFICYEFIFTVLLSMVENRDVFASAIKDTSRDHSLKYPSSLIMAFVKFCKEKGYDFFNTSDIMKYFENSNGRCLTVCVLKLNHEGVSVVEKYSQDARDDLSVITLSSDEIKNTKKLVTRIMPKHFFLIE